MNRSSFLKTITGGLISLVILSQLALSQNTNEIPLTELLGQGQPKLYGTGYNLREAAHLSFLKLQAAALKDGIKISVVSSYRSFEHQKRIWERKFKSNQSKGLSETKNIAKIIEYSTIPGTSRHHWGTDMDIIDANAKRPSSLLDPDNFEGDGPYCKLKEWMDKHANSYGFYLVYTDKTERSGFKYEPWHYSYKPLSAAYLKQFRALNLKAQLKKQQLSGSSSFNEAFINAYINGNILDINPELL